MDHTAKFTFTFYRIHWMQDVSKRTREMPAVKWTDHSFLSLFLSLLSVTKCHASFQLQDVITLACSVSSQFHFLLTTPYFHPLCHCVCVWTLTQWTSIQSPHCEAFTAPCVKARGESSVYEVNLQLIQ